jgi:hypothetical protein
MIWVTSLPAAVPVVGGLAAALLVAVGGSPIRSVSGIRPLRIPVAVLGPCTHFAGPFDPSSRPTLLAGSNINRRQERGEGGVRPGRDSPGPRRPAAAAA